MAKTYKHIFDDGYTTYNDDGSTSKTYKNLFGDGYTTYGGDGSMSKTYENLFGGGYTTYGSDGSKSRTYKHVFGDGYTTYGSDGSTSKTYKNLFDGGYTTYTTNPSGSRHVGNPSTYDYSGGIHSGGGYSSFYGSGRRAPETPMHKRFNTIGNVGYLLIWLSVGIDLACICVLPNFFEGGFPYALLTLMKAVGIGMVGCSNKDHVSALIISSFIVGLYALQIVIYDSYLPNSPDLAGTVILLAVILVISNIVGKALERWTR